jgi:CheY-like chemotaxis protein
VDDEARVRQVLHSFLEELGFSVIEAGDGLSGIQAYAQHETEISAVLMDFTMPGLDGLSAARDLLERRPELPIVLMSGYHQEVPDSDWRRAGIRGFLKKPFRRPELAEALRAALEPAL